MDLSRSLVSQPMAHAPTRANVQVEAEERLERKMSVILEEWEQCGHTEDTAPSFLEEIEVLLAWGPGVHRAPSVAVCRFRRCVPRGLVS